MSTINRTNATEARAIYAAAVQAASAIHTDPYSHDVANWAGDFDTWGYQAGSLVAYAEQRGTFIRTGGIFPRIKADAREILAEHDRRNGWA